MSRFVKNLLIVVGVVMTIIIVMAMLSVVVSH